MHSYSISRLLTVLLFFVLGFFVCETTAAQDAQPRYWKAIQKFKKQDSLHFPGKGKLVLIGSSSFTRWKDVQDYFPEYPLINRGFGGARVGDLIRYVDDIVTPYHPKQVLIYCGNDLGDASLSPADIAGLFRQLFEDIRKKNKNVPIAVLSVRPEKSDVGNAARIQKKKETNRLIEKFVRSQNYSAFINIYDPMHNPDGTLKNDIFVPDGHMNDKGNRIWKKVITPYLIK